MMKSFLISCRSFAFLLPVLSLLFPAISFAQNERYVANWLESYRFAGDFQSIDLLRETTERTDLSSVAENATVFNLNTTVLTKLLSETPPTITLSIPNAYGKDFSLELVQVGLLAPGFSLGTLGNQAQDNLPYQPGVHYRGIIRGNPHSVAALSIFPDGVMGMMSDESGTYQLGRMEDGSEDHILYRAADLKAQSPMNCFSDDVSLSTGNEESAGDRGVGCKTVQVYFECDFKLYVDKGSNTTNVTNYVTGLFNQVAALYANENVGIAISQIYVWTSTDPYASLTSTGAVLNSFRTTRGTNFTGNLAHFLSTRNLGGGIAYVDVICLKQYAFGVSAITTSYQNVPTYSWSVEVVTHELGHNLGSWHTHSCQWPNGALDNCVSPEGSCSPGPAPINGGTIMSYCHLTGTGINFNNGFGPVPGNQIRAKVLAATCLPQSGNAPTGLNATAVTNSSVTLVWGAVPGATTYTVEYKVSTSSTWTSGGTSNIPSKTLSGLAANTTYNWQVKTDCSSFSVTSSFTTSNTGGGGACEAPGSLAASGITSSSAIVSWAVVSGAANYTVQYKTSGASVWLTAGITAGVSYTLTGLAASTSYNWQVKANCSSFGAIASFTTGSSGGGGACNAPVNLNNANITATTAVINWSAVSGASNYTLQIKLANSSTYFTLGVVTSTQVTISGLQPATSYHWRVKASCSGYSISKLLTTPANLMEPPVDGMPQLVVQEAQLYPNPTAGQLTLDYPGLLTPGSSISVADATGRIWLQHTLSNAQQVIDVAQLPAGMYMLLVLEAETRVLSKRFVKM